MKPQPPLAPIARQLIEARLLTEAQARRIQAEAIHSRHDFIACLLQTRHLTALALAEQLARLWQWPLLDLQAIKPGLVTLKPAQQALVRQHRMLPIFCHAGVMYLAVADPNHQDGVAQFRFSSDQPLIPVIVEYDKLARRIDHEFSPLAQATQGLAHLAEQYNTRPTADTDASYALAAADGEPEQPVIQFINQILLEAVERRASDIHFEPAENAYRIRMRQDGILYDMVSPPAHMGAHLTARLKVMARLDLAERRLPQDGRIQLNPVGPSRLDLRIATCPTLHGEKVVVRLLDPQQARLGMDSLGYEPDQQAIFENAIHKPQGMVLITGPTGSGKTVSMYTALHRLNTTDRNISTAEDPAEIKLPGINQISISPQIGLDFATCLRAFLRQDPDIIMVGEIRDLETAEIAIKAAQTGHMVLSTLHTNDAPATLTRLMDMGVPAYNIAASITLIIAQRLARCLCPQCRIPATIPEETLLAAGFDKAQLATLQLFTAHEPGCPHCTHGHRGRVGIFQVMPVSPAIRQIIMRGGHADDIAQQAEREEIPDLRQAGLLKVQAGLISLQELNRVIRH